jgi:hypothetical protein
MMIDYGPEVGIVVLTASGIIGDSGKPQALYGYAFKSGGTAGVITWFNGTSSVSPSTVAFDHTGLISSTIVQPLNGGFVFPLGLYASLDGNVTRVTAFVRQVRTS